MKQLGDWTRSFARETAGPGGASCGCDLVLYSVDLCGAHRASLKLPVADRLAEFLVTESISGGVG